MTTAPLLALIDASGYLYRAFHAIRPLTAPDGRPTNATFGFANMLRGLLQARKPAACAVAFDRPEKTFRHEMDATYKAQRPPMPEDLVLQVDDAKKLCRLMGLTVVEEPGFEADDLIATLADRAAQAGLRVEIASADKDLFQLVEKDTISVWHPKEERLLGVEGVKDLFGVPPHLVVDVLALMGDASDNIPGVAGIGEKGAKELVNQFGPLEKIYEQIDSIKGKRRECLERGRDSAFHSRTLATVRKDAPVQASADAGEILAGFGMRTLDSASQRELALFLESLGFLKLMREMGLDTIARESAPRLESLPDHAAQWAPSEEELARLLERARSEGVLALFLETARGNPFPEEPLAVACASGDTGPFALPLSGENAALSSRFLESVFTTPGITVVLHGAKKAMLAARTLGISPPVRFFDLMLAAYVLAPGLFTHDFEGDASHFLGIPKERLISFTAGTSAGSTATLLEAQPPLSSVEGLRYLGQRVQLTSLLHARLSELLGSGESVLRKLLEEFEFPLSAVLAGMESNGILVDRAVLLDLSREFESRLGTLESEIHAAAGEKFNIGSPQQLGRILFEKLGYTALKKTAKTKSYATGSEVLEELMSMGRGPLPKLVLTWREISKLKGTYVDALPAHIARDGRIHTRFDQAVAATGRLSSNDPNLQNIPIRTAEGRAIRRAFVAPPGRVLISADYSQIELRLLAHFSGDEALIDVFTRGEDIHRATAARVFGIDPLLVTGEQRRGAKAINFGILYGMGPYALAGQLGVPQKEAKKFISAYFERFPRIKGCLDRIVEEAREKGGTETLFGRFRPIPGIKDRNFAIRSNAERMALNAPFQGTAADLIKRAMIKLQGVLPAEFPDARLLLQVHDELVLECGEDVREAVSGRVREIMENVASLRVPLTVDVAFARNWSEMK